MPLQDSLNNFRSSVAETNTFIAIAFQVDAAGNYILPQNQRNFITDSAYLKLFIAWETFLESSFLKYMLGELSVLGRTVVRYVNPRDEKHANSILIGTQKYVDWSNPDIVKRLSNLYFDVGNPIDTFIGSIHTDLMDLKTVRNAAAHLTSTTGHQLDGLASRKLSGTYSNIKVSDYIFAVDPSSPTGDTILTNYMTILDVAAEGIANA